MSNREGSGNEMDRIDEVRISVDDGVGVLELNRPSRFNCLSLESHRSMVDAIAAWKREDVRSILVCASGPHFCTGADLDCVKASLAEPEGLARFIHSGHVALRALEESGLPTVAAVQGMCLAGGIELMLACDVAFASTDARFGDQHAIYGLVPGWGGSQRLTRTIGRRRALDLFFTARHIGASEALDWGLVNYVSSAEALRSDALAYCKALSARSKVGIAAMKRLAYSGMNLGLGESLDLEEGVALRLLLGKDARAGLDAFGARQVPVFPGNRDPGSGIGDR